MENEFNDVQRVEKRPAAEDLAGITINGRFRLERRLHLGKQESGGNFGVGYVATDLHDGNQRFVKIVDFRKRMHALEELSDILDWAKFEVLMHKACMRMSKVVRMVAHGQLAFLEDGASEPYNFICVVMELGEGDIKNHIDYDPKGSVYWKLWVLREISLAIVQMERASLAHNDIKPSNVIRFGSDGDRHSIKLGDVGRAVTKSGDGPFDDWIWAGDPRHKPLETLYGYQEREWQDRSTAADAYMLGNLAAFLFAGASMTERIVSSLPPALRPGTFIGNYRDIIDVIRHAWNTVLEEQITPTFPEQSRDELSRIIRGLTDPDPAVRGEPGARKTGTLGLDRIHSQLERIARQAQITERIASTSP